MDVCVYVCIELRVIPALLNLTTEPSECSETGGYGAGSFHISVCISYIYICNAHICI